MASDLGWFAGGWVGVGVNKFIIQFSSNSVWLLHIIYGPDHESVFSALAKNFHVGIFSAVLYVISFTFCMIGDLYWASCAAVSLGDFDHFQDVRKVMLFTFWMQAWQAFALLIVVIQLMKIRKHASASKCACPQACGLMYLHASVHACIHTHMHTHTPVYVYSCTHTHICTHPHTHLWSHALSLSRTCTHTLTNRFWLNLLDNPCKTKFLSSLSDANLWEALFV